VKQSSDRLFLSFRIMTVNLWVVSPDTRSERRIDPHITVENLRVRLPFVTRPASFKLRSQAKLEPITGIPANNQSISLLDSEKPDATVVAKLDDDTRPLGFYGIRDWQVLKVSDLRKMGNSDRDNS
jgi:tubulin-specific chaperone B